MKDKTETKKSFVQRIPSIVGVLICVLLAPILLMNITIVIKSTIKPDAVPDFFGIKPFVVLSGSMETTIMEGDLAVTRVVDPATLQVGDIVSFKEGKSVITHRIIGLTEKGGEPAFVMQGDANNAKDESAVSYSQVEGLYQFRIPGMGKIAMFMQTPIGMLVFIGIPLCGFIVYDLIRRRLSDRKELKEGDEAQADAQAEIERLKAALAAQTGEPQEALTEISEDSPEE